MKSTIHKILQNPKKCLQKQRKHDNISKSSKRHTIEILLLLFSVCDRTRW